MRTFTYSAAIKKANGLIHVIGVGHFADALCIENQLYLMNAGLLIAPVVAAYLRLGIIIGARNEHVALTLQLLEVVLLPWTSTSPKCACKSFP